MCGSASMSWPVMGRDSDLVPGMLRAAGMLVRVKRPVALLMRRAVVAGDGAAVLGGLSGRLPA